MRPAPPRPAGTPAWRYSHAGGQRDGEDDHADVDDETSVEAAVAGHRPAERRHPSDGTAGGPTGGADPDGVLADHPRHGEGAEPERHELGHTPHAEGGAGGHGQGPDPGRRPETAAEHLAGGGPPR